MKSGTFVDEQKIETTRNIFLIIMLFRILCYSFLNLLKFMTITYTTNFSFKHCFICTWYNVLVFHPIQFLNKIEFLKNLVRNHSMFFDFMIFKAFLFCQFMEHTIIPYNISIDAKISR